MIALLVVITLASLALSGALLVYVLKQSREERDRSEARAAALAELLDVRTDGEPQAATAPAIAARIAPEPLAERIVRRPGPSVEVPLIVQDDLIPAGEPSHADLFASASVAAPEHRMRRLLAPAIGIAIVGLALTSVYLWNLPTAAATHAADATSRPLELVTLRHQRQGETLVITGLVRNPPDAPAIAGLVAVAFAFDKQGTFLTSVRSVLDFPQLKAGEESPFSITIPQADGVGRYRVSFRTDAGIVQHVDRRAAAPAAVQQAAAH
jgi:hypothetical protein